MVIANYSTENYYRYSDWIWCWWATIRDAESNSVSIFTGHLLLFYFQFVRWDFGYCGHLLAYCTSPGWWLWRNWWNEEWQGKPKYSEKTYPSVTLSTTNPTWLDPGLNPGRRGGKPVTNRLSYGAAWGDRFLLNVAWLSLHYTVPYLRR
jgi:hypothetical protein